MLSCRAIKSACGFIMAIIHWLRHADHRLAPICRSVTTPEAVHYGTAVALTQRRADTLDAAFAANPIRFKGLASNPPELPPAAWINPPKQAVAHHETDARLLT